MSDTQFRYNEDGKLVPRNAPIQSPVEHPRDEQGRFKRTSLDDAYKSTRKPVEPKEKPFMLFNSLPKNDPLRIEQARKHHGKKD